MTTVQPTRIPSILSTRGNASRLAGAATLLRWLALPLSAPVDAVHSSPAAARWWRAASALTVLPYTAVLHWGVFHRGTCILNNFGHEYTPAVLGAWIKGDPSLGWAIAWAMATYLLGLRLAALRALVAPALLAFLPFVVWIWDIPFSGRAVCHTGHDDRILLADGSPLRTSIILGVCAMAWLVLATLELVRLGAGRQERAVFVHAVDA